MKKTFFLFLIIFLIIGSFIFIKKKKTNDVEIKVYYVDSLPEEEVTLITFCAVNKYHDFDLINLEVPKNVDIYQYVFKLYNYKRNALPLEFTVYSKYLLELETITIEDDVLYLKIKNQKIPPDDFHWTMYALKITYKYLGIKEIQIDFNNCKYIY